MSLHEKLRELRNSLAYSVEIIDSMLALLHFDPPPSQDVSSGESDYASADDSDRQIIPSPPPLVRQSGLYPPIELTDDDEVKLEIPPSRRNADGTITYIRQRWDD
jgi:hypothetical protein